MDKRDNTIRGLEYLAKWLHGKFEQTGEGDYELDAQTAENAIELLKALDVKPEELERLKKCRHECKIDCLLEQYERIKDERDALLKARLPRVLKLEELLSICEEPVWLEPKSGKSYTGWVLIDNIREGAEGTDIKLCMTRPGRVMVCPNIDLYGSKWRCWTSRPTTEQMEAEPWATKQE